MEHHPGAVADADQRAVPGTGGHLVADQDRVRLLGERAGRGVRPGHPDGVVGGVVGVGGVEQPEGPVHLHHVRRLDQTALPGLVLRDQPSGLPDQSRAGRVELLDRDPGVDADPVAVVLPVQVPLSVRRQVGVGVDRAAVLGLADQRCGGGVDVRAAGLLGHRHPDRLDVARLGRRRGGVVHQPATVGAAGHLRRPDVAAPGPGRQHGQRVGHRLPGDQIGAAQRLDVGPVAVGGEDPPAPVVVGDDHRIGHVAVDHRVRERHGSSCLSGSGQRRTRGARRPDHDHRGDQLATCRPRHPAPSLVASARR